MEQEASGGEPTGEATTPAAEAAGDHGSGGAVDAAKEKLEEVKEKLGPKIEEAKEKLGPKIEEASKKAGPTIDKLKNTISELLGKLRKKPPA
ncbi:MAG: hypothetical protein LC792_15115 [Actinobacteria bacterium]|nr:hypothetical protein [Actinomycetota bacterium]